MAVSYEQKSPESIQLSLFRAIGTTEAIA